MASPESLAFRNAYSDIAEILQHQVCVTVVACKLYSLRIISKHTKNQVSNFGRDVNGVWILLPAIESKIQKKPSAFNTFVTYLSEEDVFSEVVEKLKTERDHEQAMQRNSRVGKLYVAEIIHTCTITFNSYYIYF